MNRLCRLLHGQPFQWNYFPLLTGRIVLSNKNRNLSKYSVVFLSVFQKTRYLADQIKKSWKTKHAIWCYPKGIWKDWLYDYHADRVHLVLSISLTIRYDNVLYCKMNFFFIARNLAAKQIMATKACKYFPLVTQDCRKKKKNQNRK